MLRKLRNKLLLINMISISAVIIVSFVLFYIVAGVHMDSTDLQRLRSVPTDSLVQSIIAERNVDRLTPNAFPKGPFINPDRDLPIDYNNAFVINVDDFNDTLFIFSRIDLKEKDYSKAVDAARKQQSETGNISLQGEKWKFLFTGDNDEYILFLNVNDTVEARTQLLLNMIVMGFCVLGIVFLICFFQANRAIRPVDESFNKQKRFIADASHELKTPLAIIDASTEAMSIDGTSSIESQRKWLDRIGEESTRMRKLIESLLYLAKSEDSSYEIMPVNLTQIVNDEVGRVEAILFERNIELTIMNYQGGSLIVKADNEKIGESILILLDNAVKYTDDGGKVIVETGISKHFAFVKVSNTGAGIPNEEIPKVFDRFYRVDKARNSDDGSYGLGLSIAKVIVEKSGGKINVVSENGMTSFSIELPLTSGWH